jgi:hypothetical protein
MTMKFRLLHVGSGSLFSHALYFPAILFVLLKEHYSVSSAVAGVCGGAGYSMPGRREKFS